MPFSFVTCSSQVFNTHFSPPGILGDYCDGRQYQTHDLFSKDNHALQIMLYYDDVEVCNPIGSAATIYKLGKAFQTCSYSRSSKTQIMYTVHFILPCKPILLIITFETIHVLHQLCSFVQSALDKYMYTYFMYLCITHFYPDMPCLLLYRFILLLSREFTPMSAFTY